MHRPSNQLKNYKNDPIILGLALITLIGAGCISISSNTGSSEQSKTDAQSPRIDESATTSINKNKPNSNTQNILKSDRAFTYLKSAPEFELACTTPCNVNDRAFLDAFFIGIQKGVLALKKATGGIMPKQKIEYHAGQDNDCFKSGYGEHPTGYVGYIEGKSLICGSDHYWYEKLQKTSQARDIASYQTIKRQTLTIHEAIHHIFNDYTAQGFNPPDYAIQESFAKAVSLYAVGTITGYDDKSFISGYTIENPPPKNDIENGVNFFTYSLNRRFGFKPSHTKDFFKQYRALETTPMSGNKKVKKILDKILNVDVKESFSDIHVNITNTGN